MQSVCVTAMVKLPAQKQTAYRVLHHYARISTPTATVLVNTTPCIYNDSGIWVDGRANHKFADEPSVCWHFKPSERLRQWIECTLPCPQVNPVVVPLQNADQLQTIRYRSPIAAYCFVQEQIFVYVDCSVRVVFLYKANSLVC